MKKTLLALSFILFSIQLFAQSDKIFKHNGKTIDVNVVKVNEFNIVYKYVGEDAEQTIGKYAVEKVVYGKSKRVEKMTDKIEVSSDKDWESVVVLEDKSEVAGLSKVGEVRGKSAFISYRSKNGADKKAFKSLKEAAAKEGAPFILVVSETEAKFASTQSVKNGVAYKYEE